MAFDFPDPSVTKTVTNPTTNATYQWQDVPGKWVLTTTKADKEEVTRPIIFDPNLGTPNTPGTPPTSHPDFIGSEADLIVCL